MSEDSRSERERLKEEYKTHYRKMRSTKERLSRAKKKQNIVTALRDMDKTQMLESFDDFLLNVKHKLASVEARLDVAMNSMESFEVEPPQASDEQLDEQMNRVKAKETLKQVKMEMGLIYEEIEQQAGSIQVEKTIGSGSEQTAGPDAEEIKEK